MGCPSHMDLPDQGNTFGPLLLDFQSLAKLLILTLNVHVLIVEAKHISRPSWEMISSVRVGKLGGGQRHCITMTHCGMVRAVNTLPAVS